MRLRGTFCCNIPTFPPPPPPLPQPYSLTMLLMGWWQNYLDALVYAWSFLLGLVIAWATFLCLVRWIGFLNDCHRVSECDLLTVSVSNVRWNWKDIYTTTLYRHELKWLRIKLYVKHTLISQGYWSVKIYLIGVLKESLEFNFMSSKLIYKKNNY